MPTEAKWGAFQWGELQWGAGAPASLQTQSEQASALKSTVVLGLSSTPQTDLSQYGTNLTASGTGAYETSSSRGAITTPRTLYVRTTIDPGTHTVRTLLYHGNTANSDHTFKISTDIAGDLEFSQNASALLTIAASTFAAGNRDLSIQWSTRANPDTTGASDAQISEIVIYDHGNSTYYFNEQQTHAVATTNATWGLSCGGYWDGAVLQQQPPNIIQKWRVDGASYYTAHFASHWVAQRADGAVSSVIEHREPLALTKASGIGDQNEFAGPPLFYVLKHQREAYRRCLSPLVNEVYGTNASTLSNTYAPAKWHKKAVGSTVYRWAIPWLRWCVVPPNCNYIFTRVQIHSTVSSGGSVPVGIRVYSFNRIPTLGKAQYEGQEPPPYKQWFKGEKLDADHGAGQGAWVVNGLVRISRNTHPHPKFKDTTHLCIAYAIDPDNESANDANEQLKIQAWQAWPVSYQPNNGGGGMGGGGGGDFEMG